MNERLKNLRSVLGISQRDFSQKVNIGHSTLAMFETGDRIPKDIHISQICSTFNVNEDWLRNGTGEMFIKPTTFSLDEYAKKQDLRESEISLIREFMELDKNTRNALYDMFNRAFASETQAVSSSKSSIDAELASTTEDLEGAYKKSFLKNASKPVRSASNITEGTNKKEA